jgi:hypothetical protein
MKVSVICVGASGHGDVRWPKRRVLKRKQYRVFSLQCAGDSRQPGEGLRCSRYHKPCFHRKCRGNAGTVSRSSWYAVGRFPISVCTSQQSEHDGTVLENSCGRAALVRTQQNIDAVRVAMQINPRKYMLKIVFKILVDYHFVRHSAHYAFSKTS